MQETKDILTAEYQKDYLKNEATAKDLSSSSETGDRLHLFFFAVGIRVLGKKVLS